MWPPRHGFGKNAQQTGAFIAVGILLLQNLVDLATEIPSVAIATFVLLGTIHGTTDYLAERRHERPRSNEHRIVSRSKTPTFVTAAFLIPTVALVVLVAKTSLPDVIDQRFELSKALTGLTGKPKGHPDFGKVQAQVATALLRCPADPYVPLIGALLTRESGKSPYVWLNQALRRDPLSARPHLLLAETLAARGALNQALLELKTTVKYAPQLVEVVAEHVLRWAPGLEQMLKAVPDGTDGIPLLNTLAARHAGSPERVALRQRLLALSLERNPRETSTNAIFVNDLFTALAGNVEPCVGDGKKACEERLHQHAAIVLADRTKPQLTVLLHAQLLAYEKKYDEADRWLTEHCSTLPDPVSCNRTRVIYAERLTEPGRFDEAATTYAASACSTPTNCAAAFDWLGAIEAQRNNPLLALSRFERAAEELPTAEAWLKVAESAARAGQYNRSETALATVRRLGGASKTADLEKRLLEIRRTRMLQELEK
jgi:tetratricopeptide (TPR) repeat protein